MSDVQQAGAYEFVTLTDRTGKGGCEFIFDGIRFTLKPGKPSIAVPRFVAEWLFKVDQQKFNTVDGDYVCRFAVTDGPEDLMDALGPEAFDASPIVIDEAALEGWNAAEADPDRAKAKALRLKARPSDFPHQGGPKTGTFSGQSKGREP